MVVYREGNNWDFKMFNLLLHLKEWSKDKSTKVPALIVDSEYRIISTGYNGFPIGVNDNIESRHERPIKYLFTEHAERNAIYGAAKNGIALEKKIMYLLDGPPCADCTRAIIQSGITTIITTDAKFTSNNTSKWDESFDVAKQMINESNISIIYITNFKEE